MAKRGELTAQVQAKAVELLGKEISYGDLRLMPYVQYLLVNSMNIDPKKVNQLERDLLSCWRINGWLEGGASNLRVEKGFWNALHEILWLAYVVYEEQE